MKSAISRAYPFSAVVGQEQMKLALILNLIDPRVGGVLMMGHRGTGKSTVVRALPDLLPQISVISGCPYRCDPADERNLCCQCKQAVDAESKLGVEKGPVPVVELPLGATEDRVCGTIDLEQALGSGVKRFEPGLLARANRGFLYIDEVNLLEDHLVDLLLDVAVTGINKVERESISVEHPARFVLIGSGNPEEGELRPQLLDRFGLYVEVTTEDEIEQRVEIVERCNAFERDQEIFHRTFAGEQEGLRRKITRARKNLRNVKLERKLVRDIARLCSELKVDGHRGELTIARAAAALASFEGRKKVTDTDVKRIAVMTLRHRLHRSALEEAPGAERIEEALDKVFAKTHDAAGGNDEGGSAEESEENRWRQEGAHGKRVAPSSGSAPRRRQAESHNGNSAGNTLTNLKAVPAPLPVANENPPQFKLDKKRTRDASRTNASFQPGRHSTLTKPIYDHERGRYARSVSANAIRGNTSSRIAVDATLRALISSRLPTPATTTSLIDGRRQLTHVSADSLRFKLFKRKQGRLFILAIDCSGSMALNRIAQARVTMLGLLRQSYVKRDSVAIVAFRNTSAEILLPPSRSIMRARRVLDSLGIGGGTPLSAGLECALQIAKRMKEREGELTVLLFTDGHANVSLEANSHDAKESKDPKDRRRVIASEVKGLGAGLKKAGVRTVLIDTQNRFTAGLEARALAQTLGAEYQVLHSDAVGIVVPTAGGKP